MTAPADLMSAAEWTAATSAPAWTALFLGLYAMAAGIGELRAPGHWHKMLRQIAASPALQVLTGLIQVFLGAVVYLANPWTSPDWLSPAMNLFGGLMVVEGLVILAFSDVFLPFWVRRIGAFSRLWALFSILLGIALIALAIARF